MMKTVLITGCSSGFGRGMVDEFLQRGWHVIATMRNADQRQELLAEPLEHYDHRLTILSLDITDAQERQAIAHFVREQGRLDCLVNNAGIGYFGALENLSEADLRSQFEVNVFGTVLLTRSLLPYLRQAQGSLIFLSSIFGFLGFPLTSAYCASKFAIEGFAETLHYELKPHGVHVAIVEPGGSKTNFGKNIVWTPDAEAAYQRQTANYHRLTERIGAQAKTHTPKVAQTVADLAEGRNCRLRVRIGQDAIRAYWAKTLMPEPLWKKFLSRFYQQAFLAPD